MIYDIIGDIHGQYDLLIGLLKQLGYRHNGSCYQAPANHQAIFIGDFIDRNPNQLNVLKTVFAMIDNGQAKAVMGNHELNAIAYSVLGDDKEYLRAHTNSNTKQHQIFLDEFTFGSLEYYYWINRFYELPLWLDLGQAFIIHACPHQSAMATLSPYLHDNQLTLDTIKDIYQNKEAFCALEILLKGVEVHIPDPYYIIDPQGTKRQNVRIAWWQENLTQPLLNICCSSTCDMNGIPPDFVIPIEFQLTMDCPIFIGHYWLSGTPTPLSHQVVCTDYSAGQGDKLVAYQFDTDNPIINQQNFRYFDKS